MSEQPPLIPPSGAEPVFPVYDAPAYGDVAPEPAYPVVPPAAGSYQVPAQYLGGYGTPTDPMATASLVLGIVGIVSLLLTPLLVVSVVGGICSPIAIVLGAVSRRRIRRDPRRFAGSGIAVGGLVTGIVGTVLAVLAVIAIVAFVALVTASFNDF